MLSYRFRLYPSKACERTLGRQLELCCCCTTACSPS
jgi:hypothetical protein